MQIQKCYKKQLLKIYELQIIGKLYLQLVQGWWEGFLNPVGEIGTIWTTILNNFLA